MFFSISRACGPEPAPLRCNVAAWTARRSARRKSSRCVEGYANSRGRSPSSLKVDRQYGRRCRSFLGMTHFGSSPSPSLAPVDLVELSFPLLRATCPAPFTLRHQAAVECRYKPGSSLNWMATTLPSGRPDCNRRVRMAALLPISPASPDDTSAGAEFVDGRSPAVLEPTHDRILLRQRLSNEHCHIDDAIRERV